MAATQSAGADPREEQLRRLAQELAVSREEFRKARAKQQAELAEQRAELAARRAEVGQLQAAARADRFRARNLHKRLKTRAEAEAAAAGQKVATDREELEQREARLRDEAECLQREREEFAAQVAAHQARLSDAWEQLTENQRRLLVDREQAEAWIATQTSTLDRRAASLDEKQGHAQARQAALEARAASLVSEIAGLEARALNTRAVLKHLEERRARTEAEVAASTAIPSTGVVWDAQDLGGVAPARPVDRLLTELQAGEQQLHRDRARLSAVEAALDRRETDLGDQRAILVEQVAALVSARQTWQSTEIATVGELESLATALRARELAADERDRLLLAADRGRRDREQQLWDLRAKIEAWQASLAAHEAALATHRGRIEADLLAKREHLVKWEVSLSEVARAWADLRDRERRHLADELAETADTRARYARRLAEVDKLAERLVAELDRLAPFALAMEEAAATGAAGKRRVRLMRRRWERAFGGLRKELDARRVALSVEALDAEERTKALRDATAELTARMADAAAARRQDDLTALAAGHAVDDLAWDAPEPTPAEEVVLELRREVDDLAVEVLTLPVPTREPALARAA